MPNAIAGGQMVRPYVYGDPTKNCPIEDHLSRSLEVIESDGVPMTSF